MSENSTNDLDLNLHFLPEWAKQGSSKQIYDKYTGNEEVERPRSPRRNDGDRRPSRPSGTGRPPSSGGGSGGGGDRERERGGDRRQNRDRSGSPQGGRRQGGRQGDSSFSSGGSRPPRRDTEPLPDIDVSITADEAVSNSLAEQIKLTARAYPLFSIAQMILGKPERYVFKLASVKKKGSDDAAQKLFQCALDETVWLNQSDAIDHLMKNHLGTFYETVKTASEPPKGTYTFVAQCGMSGVILGPPNYHDYQNQLRNLYNERFEKKMSFDRFKSRVKIVKDEETVKKWLDEQSFVTTYRVLNSPEQLILESWTQVLEHFNENHLPNLIVEISKHTIPGAQADNYPCPQIRRLIRVRLQEQKRFPLKVVHLLSQQFSTRGLQFFKVNKTVTHVCVSRPHYLDLDSTNVKDGIRRIIDFIQSHPGCNRKQLVDTLVTMEIPVAESSPVFEPAETVQPSESAENPPAPESSESVQAAQETTSKPAVASSSEPSAAQKAIISDLHWLLYQGNVIEFASGVLEVAKKPLEKKKAPAAAPKVASEPVSDAVAPADTPSGIQETSGELPPSDTEIQAEPAESVSDFGADNVQCDNGGEQITFESPTPATDQSADTEAPRPAQDSNSQPNNPV